MFRTHYMGQRWDWENKLESVAIVLRHNDGDLTKVSGGCRDWFDSRNILKVEMKVLANGLDIWYEEKKNQTSKVLFE